MVMLGVQAVGAATVAMPFRVTCWDPLVGLLNAAVPECPAKLTGI
jgi:hypothetical protein